MKTQRLPRKEKKRQKKTGPYLIHGILIYKPRSIASYDDAPDFDDMMMFVWSPWECLNCGAYMDHDGSFCDEHCEWENRYQNRTCETCGGEFWDGGTSCDCEDWDEDNSDSYDDLLEGLYED